MKGNNNKYEAEKTLILLDSISKVNAGPFFQTRLDVKLEAILNNKTPFIWRFSLKPALLISLITINVIISISYLSSVKSYYALRENTLQTMVKNYFPQTSNGNLYNLQTKEGI